MVVEGNLIVYHTMWLVYSPTPILIYIYPKESTLNSYRYPYAIFPYIFIIYGIWAVLSDEQMSKPDGG